MPTRVLPHTLSKDEKSTLLYLETCLVDYDGRVNHLRMNPGDIAWAHEMTRIDFIQFGRIVVQDHNRDGSMWVTFSDEAWQLAHRLRRERSKRSLARRSYRTTKEASSKVGFVE